MLVICIAGCVATTSPTGVKHYSLDPNTGAIIQTTLDSATVCAASTSVIWPGLAGVALILGWASGLWKTLNPVLSAAVAKQEVITKTLSSVVNAVEQVSDNTTPTGAGVASSTIGDVIKPVVASNLAAAGITAEGKVLISEAKS